MKKITFVLWLVLCCWLIGNSPGKLYTQIIRLDAMDGDVELIIKDKDGRELLHRTLSATIHYDLHVRWHDRVENESEVR